MARVYISPSKQEANVGVGNYGTEEKRMNEVADVVERCLKWSGINCFRNDPDMTLSQIVTDSNKSKVDLHIALHSNAGNGKARGAEVLVYKKGGEAEKFANILYKNISDFTPTEDRGVKANPSLYELKNTTAPAALIEYAFHDNTKDEKFIVDNITKLGVLTAQSICNYLGVKLINPYEQKYYVKINEDEKILGPYDNKPKVEVIKK